MSDFLEKYSDTRSFPCKHEVWNLLDIVADNTDESLSHFQAYFVGDIFSFPCNDNECPHCAQEDVQEVDIAKV